MRKRRRPILGRPPSRRNRMEWINSWITALISMKTIVSETNRAKLRSLVHARRASTRPASTTKNRITVPMTTFGTKVVGILRLEKARQGCRVRLLPVFRDVIDLFPIRINLILLRRPTRDCVTLIFCSLARIRVARVARATRIQWSPPAPT
jgi:hypothetical protein